MRLLGLILILPFLSGCSVYESDGRKFLESQGLQFAGVSAQENLVACNHDASPTGWMLLEKTPRATVYALEGETYEMRVKPQQDEAYNCYYHFASAQEMYKKSTAAVDLTIFHLNSVLPPPKPR